MAFKQLGNPNAELRLLPSSDEGAVAVGGAVVLTSPRPRYQNLQSAVEDLVAVFAQGENLKIRAARIVQAIRDQQLYRELGFESFKDYLPALLSVTAGIGWTAERTLKAYLQFVDVYLDQLHFDEQEATGAVTHLQLLTKLVERDSDGLLKLYPEKVGKVGAAEFEAVSRVISWLVNKPSAEITTTGADEGAIGAALVEAGLATELQVFQNVAGFYPSLPVGGWQVADTKALIDRVAKKERPQKAQRVWNVQRLGDDRIRLVSLWVLIDGVLLLEHPLGSDRELSQQELEALTAGDKVEELKDE